MIQRTILAILLLACVATLAAQDGLSNLRIKPIKLQSSWQQLDSLPIAPGTIQFLDRINAPKYELDWNKIKFIDPDTTKTDSIWVQFRVWSVDISQTYFRIDSSFLSDPSLPLGKQPAYNPFRAQGQAADFGGLDYNGTFARGIAFGNNQNLVLNSSFNLQLAGEIGDGIELLAAITDENIPIQPEGNTQQLREFDRIFIQLKKGNTQVIAGDYEISRPTGYFMNYFKKLQGATVQTQQTVFNGTLNTTASAALARGKFARNSFLGQEGNQGPYRLEGAEGEQFIIVLAGTEKVYIDGLLLTRGQDADYIINYNRGDITFTNQRLITKDIRIIVEFEYNDQSYIRSLVALNTELKYDRFSAYLNAYSEQDGRTRLGEGPLSELEQNILRDAGDDPLKSVLPGLDTLGSTTDPIAYRQIDTLVNGVFYRDVLVYVPSPNEEETLYTASFSDVGLGNGNYTRPPSTANGIVYTWVAPDPILGPQGQYEPIVRLVPPNQQQLYTLGAKYKTSEKGSISGEVALSQYDLNRFSTVDAEDDLGWAGYLKYDQAFQLSPNWALQGQAQYEHLQANFEDLNPYRSPEFTRDWSTNRTERVDEDLGHVGFLLENDSMGFQLGYQLGGYFRDTAYQGIKQDFKIRLAQNGWLLRGDGSLLNATTGIERNEFFRPRLTLEKTLEKADDWVIGVYGEREKNSRFVPASDTLDQSSFYYDLYKVYIEQNTYEKVQLGIYYNNRIDYAPVGSDFSTATAAQSLQIKGNWTEKWNKNNRSILTWDLTYRQLEIPDTTLSAEQAAETYLGRLDYGITLLKGVIRYNNSYQIGSGQEQKLLFFYQAVNPGEGIYKHIDYNDDGIEQNNEFVISPNQDEATHIRVIIFSNEFVRTNNIQFNQSLQLEPKALWYNKKGLKGFISKFSTISNWQIARKAQAEADNAPWNPFDRQIPDSVLVNSNVLIQNSIFFNRLNQVFNMQFNWTDRQTRILLTTGVESRRNEERQLQARYNLDKRWSIAINASEGFRSNTQENFETQNFNIRFYRLEPLLSWQPSENFRMQGQYEWSDLTNDAELGAETAAIHNFQLEMQYNKAAKTSVRTNLTFAQVVFDGEVDSPVGFALLNNLRPGANYLWNITFDRQLARNIRLNLSYEGRKTGMAKIVHVGRAQVAATF